jgi:hypothetical protein
VKQTIAELERRVEDLTKQLIAAKLENDSLKEENQLNPPGCIPQTIAPELVPISDPDAIYPGMEVVSQRRNHHMAPYLPVASQSQFSQSLVPGPAEPGPSKKTFDLYVELCTDSISARKAGRT